MLFIFVIVAFFCFSNGLADLQIEAKDSEHRVTESEEVYVTYNKQITLRCYSSEENETLHWEYSSLKTNSFRLLEPSKEIQIHESSASEVLVDISKVRPKMGGRYRCKQGNRARTVTVSVFPEPIATNGRFVMTEKAEVIENVRLVFYYPQKKMDRPMSCTYFVPDNLIENAWLKWEGGLLETNQDYYKLVLEKGGEPGGHYVKGSLSIVKENPPESLFTEYSCTLCAKRVCNEETLNVRMACCPYVAEKTNNRSVNYGEKVILTATVENNCGEQPISLTWEKDGNEILTNAKGELIVPSGKMSKRANYGKDKYKNDQLIFDSVTSKDSAVYSYTYNFKGAKASAAYILRVQGHKETRAWVAPLIATVAELVLVALIITVSTFYEKQKIRDSRGRNQDNQSSAHDTVVENKSATNPAKIPSSRT